MEPQQVPASALASGDATRIAIHVGLDLAAGRSAGADYTALTVAEVLERARSGAPLPPAPYSVDEIEQETFYRVRSLARLPHGLGWQEIGALVAAILAGIWEQEATRQADLFASERRALPLSLYADRTGLGDALVALLQQALADDERTRAVNVWPLSFVHGVKYDRAHGVVGKTHLIGNLQALLATDPSRVELPKQDPMTPTLLEEIGAYRIHIEAASGKETLGGVGAHDDMVTALALAVLEDPRAYDARSIPFRADGWW